jgi:hypothetical protein
MRNEYLTERRLPDVTYKFLKEHTRINNAVELIHYNRGRLIAMEEIYSVNEGFNARPISTPEIHVE